MEYADADQISPGSHLDDNGNESSASELDAELICRWCGAPRHPEHAGVRQMKQTTWQSLGGGLYRILADGWYADVRSIAGTWHVEGTNYSGPDADIRKVAEEVIQ